MTSRAPRTVALATLIAGLLSLAGSVALLTPAAATPAPTPEGIVEVGPVEIVRIGSTHVEQTGGTGVRHTAAAPAAKLPTHTPHCRLHRLEQGGRPGARTVLACG